MVSPQNHEAHDYAERIRARLPSRLQELRESMGLSRYALAKKSGVLRDMVGCIEEGESIPTLHVSARLVYGVDLTLTEFVRPREAIRSPTSPIPSTAGMSDEK